MACAQRARRRINRARRCTARAPSQNQRDVMNAEVKAVVDELSTAIDNIRRTNESKARELTTKLDQIASGVGDVAKLRTELGEFKERIEEIEAAGDRPRGSVDGTRESRISRDHKGA